jgi:AraC family transcriptional regulator
LKTPKEEVTRINKVLRFIDLNLERNLLLEDLAGVASYSPFHFQRIFKSEIGETPKQYIKRLRLEKAAHMIVLFPEKPILEIALDNGFNSPEAFSRAFREYYKVSPDKFRKAEETEKIKIIQQPGFNQNFLKSAETFLPAALVPSTYENLKIEVINRTAVKLIYIQTTLENPDTVKDSFRKIKMWAEAREIFEKSSVLTGLMRDYPIFTALDKCRFFTCATVSARPELSGIVNFMEVPAGKYASFNVSGGIPEIMKCCTYLVHHWLPGNGYKIVHEHAILLPQSDPVNTSFTNNLYQVLIKICPA